MIGKSFARIHQQNLVNFGVLPVVLDDPAIYDRLAMADMLILTEMHVRIAGGRGAQAATGAKPRLEVVVHAKQLQFTVSHALSPREVEVLLAGGLTNWLRARVSPPRG